MNGPTMTLLRLVVPLCWVVCVLCQSISAEDTESTFGAAFAIPTISTHRRSRYESASEINELVSKHPEELVNTLGGTDSRSDRSHGCTLPLIAVPWGFNAYAPQTNEAERWPGGWFHPNDRRFFGLRVTHQPSPWIGDYGHFIIKGYMPVAPNAIHLPDVQTPYSPKQSIFSPYLFSTALLAYSTAKEETRLDFAPTSHGGIMRMRFPKYDTSLVPAKEADSSSHNNSTQQQGRFFVIQNSRQSSSGQPSEQTKPAGTKSVPSIINAEFGGKTIQIQLDPHQFLQQFLFPADSFRALDGDGASSDAAQEGALVPSAGKSALEGTPVEPRGESTSRGSGKVGNVQTMQPPMFGVLSSEMLSAALLAFGAQQNEDVDQAAGQDAAVMFQIDISDGAAAGASMHRSKKPSGSSAKAQVGSQVTHHIKYAPASQDNLSGDISDNFDDDDDDDDDLSNDLNIDGNDDYDEDVRFQLHDNSAASLTHLSSTHKHDHDQEHYQEHDRSSPAQGDAEGADTMKQSALELEVSPAAAGGVMHTEAVAVAPAAPAAPASPAAPAAPAVSAFTVDLIEVAGNAGIVEPSTGRDALRGRFTTRAKHFPKSSRLPSLPSAPSTEHPLIEGPQQDGVEIDVTESVDDARRTLAVVDLNDGEDSDGNNSKEVGVGDESVIDIIRSIHAEHLAQERVISQRRTTLKASQQQQKHNPSDFKESPHGDEKESSLHEYTHQSLDKYPQMPPVAPPAFNEVEVESILDLNQQQLQLPQQGSKAKKRAKQKAKSKPTPIVPKSFSQYRRISIELNCLGDHTQVGPAPVADGTIMIVGFTTKNSGGVGSKFRIVRPKKSDHPSWNAGSRAHSSTSAGRSSDSNQQQQHQQEQQQQHQQPPVHQTVAPGGVFAHYFVALLFGGPNGDIPLPFTKDTLFFADRHVVWVDLPPHNPFHQTITVRFATSFISVEQALQNLQAEVGLEKSFVQVAMEAKQAWNDALSRVKVTSLTSAPESSAETGNSEAGAGGAGATGYGVQELMDLATTFYSSLYRASLFPRSLGEVTADGIVQHWSPYLPLNIKDRVREGPLSTDSGFWDAWNTVYPLLTLTNRPQLGEMIQGWVNAYLEGGWLPKWASPGYRVSMVGTMGDVSLADAIVNDIPGFDVDLAYEAIRKDAFEEPPVDIEGVGRECLSNYTEHGFIPWEARCGEAVSRSMAYWHSDYAIAQAAAKLGFHDDAAVLHARAANYSRLFDTDRGFFRSKSFLSEATTTERRVYPTSTSASASASTTEADETVVIDTESETETDIRNHTIDTEEGSRKGLEEEEKEEEKEEERENDMEREQEREGEIESRVEGEGEGEGRSALLVDATFTEPFDEFSWGGDYTEGGPWQYRFYVPYDPAGLATLYAESGRPDMCANLEAVHLMRSSVFHYGMYEREIHEMTEMADNCWGQYSHNNQPIHHQLYMYMTVGQSRPLCESEKKYNSTGSTIPQLRCQPSVTEDVTVPGLVTRDELSGADGFVVPVGSSDTSDNYSASGDDSRDQANCAAQGQYRIRQVLRELYTPDADMFAGDEDNGEMGAWYVLSALGLYELSPGSGEFVLGSPLFGRVEIDISDIPNPGTFSCQYHKNQHNHNILVVQSIHNSRENVYVQRVTWNGEEVSGHTIQYAALAQGGELTFYMGAEPATATTTTTTAAASASD